MKKKKVLLLLVVVVFGGGRILYQYNNVNRACINIPLCISAFQLFVI